MRPGALIRAAVEVLDDILSRHRPAATALSDWGKGHRFAGSGDRSAIGNLVYDALRRRRSLAAQMGERHPARPGVGRRPARAGLSPEAVIAGADGSQHALEPLSEAEQAALSRTLPPDTPADVLGDIPDWLAPSFQRAFGRRPPRKARALAKRAPVDVRANALKADRERVLKALARFSAEPTRFSPIGVASARPKAPAASPTWRPRPATAKAGTRCRTRPPRSLR